MIRAAAGAPGTGPAAIAYKALVQDDRIHASLYTDPRIFEDEPLPNLAFLM